MKSAHGRTKKVPYLSVIVATLLVLSFLSAVSLIFKKYRVVSRVTATWAQTACDRSFFTVVPPTGETFTSGCIANNVQMYSTDNRYQFFQPQSLNNQAYIQTPNSEIKDKTSLSWDIQLIRPATIYIMTRHIPGQNQAPAWITSDGFTRHTTDDLSNINQYFLRKNDQGLIGLYDIYTKDVPAGTQKLFAASDTQAAAYSMYLVALVPSSGPSTATPAPTNTPVPTIPPGTVGKLKTVFFIPLEDADWSQVKGSSAAPYINNTLLPNFAHAENDGGGFHPSLDNYFMMESGDSYKVRSTQTPTSYRVSDTNHLTNAMKAKGVSWKSYQEGLPSGQCYTSNSTNYAVDHNPFAFYNDITGNPPSPTAPYCVEHIRPYTELASDLSNNSVAQYNFIVPSPCNQGETGCANGVASSDHWLQNELPKIMNSAAYKNGGVIFITWMEGGSATSTAPVGLIVVSPNAKKGYSNTIVYRHYSILHSIQDIFGITPLIRHAGTDPNLSDLFTSYP